MEPISAALLAALAGGAGGEAGREAWAQLSSLIRRPFRRSTDPSASAAGSGEAELILTEESPTDAGRAQALSDALTMRAAMDSDFETGLERWRHLAVSVNTDSNEVRNEISGGTFSAPVIQGRDFSGISFTTTQPPNTADPGSGSTELR